MTKARSMSQTDLGLLDEGQRSNFIRLRTMILLRWVAIGGQLIAITVAQQLYDLRLELGLCYLAVGVSVLLSDVDIVAPGWQGSAQLTPRS